MKTSRMKYNILFWGALCLGAAGSPESLKGNVSRGELSGYPSGIVISATPPPGTVAYAVEEILPPEARPRTISHGGVFDSYTGKVKWGPFFDGQSRELSLEIPGMEGALDLSGEASFNGDEPITVSGITKVTLPELDSYFDGWQHRHLLIRVSRFSGNYVAPGATLPLLAQYAMGREPEAAGSPFRVTDGSTGMEIRYLRDTRRTDVVIQVESSTDLTDWQSWEPQEMETHMLNEHIQEIRFPAGNEGFYRLRFSLDP